MFHENVFFHFFLADFPNLKWQQPTQMVPKECILKTALWVIIKHEYA